jgi:glycerol-3-phosphate dehydrogenase
MRRNLTRLNDTPFDLLVVGGGIHGACAAWDAARRGLCVALVEKEDFGGATSANSLKILHGGLRYLQNGDFRRMRQSFRERALMMRLAPHLTRELPVMVPTSPKLRESRAVLRVALRVSEAVGMGLGPAAGSDRRWQPGRILSRAECLRAHPWLETEGLTGAALWYDGQALNPERLTLSFLLSASEAGAELANYAEVVRLLNEGSRISGARVLDRVGGQELEVRARIVLNAAGPWEGRIRSLGQGPGTSPPEPTAQALAVNLVSRRPPGETAVGIRCGRGLAQSGVGGGGRHLFLVPWRDRTLIGTSYRKFSGEPGREGITEVDLRDLLKDCNQAYPGLELSWRDITFYHAGVLPLQGEGRNGARIPLASEPRILDHGREAGLEGLVSIIGVKYTTARLVAEQAIDLVFRKLGKTPPHDSMEGISIWGGEESAQEEAPPGLTAEAARRLREAYGSRRGEVALIYREESGWATPISPGCSVLRCEVLHAVREEMALKLSDVVFRRTDLGTAACPPRSQIDAVARIMGEEMGWTQECQVQEVGEVLKSYAPLSLCEDGV